MCRMLTHQQIEIAGGTQTRAEINYHLVAEYKEAYVSSPDTMPPLKVFHDGSKFWLGDGFHRWHGSKEAGMEKVECEVRQGSRLDALRYALSCNAKHGARLTNADKRHAVTLALKEPSFKEMTDREMAELCAVGHSFIAKVRSDLSIVDKSKSNDDKDLGNSAPKKRGKRGSDKSPRPPRQQAKKQGQSIRKTQAMAVEKGFGAFVRVLEKAKDASPANCKAVHAKCLERLNLIYEQQLVPWMKEAFGYALQRASA